MRQRAEKVLATVKGDVHDIGKNLVEIILRNNDYEVVNLGIKVRAELVACGVIRKVHQDKIDNIVRLIERR